MTVDELLNEKRYSPTEAAELLGCCVASLWRWSRFGLRGVRLKSTRIGARVWFLKSQLDDFLSRTQLQTVDDEMPIVTRSTEKTSNAGRAAGERLAAAGW